MLTSGSKDPQEVPDDPEDAVAYVLAKEVIGG